MLLAKLDVNQFSIKPIFFTTLTVFIACLLYKVLDYQSLKHSAVLFLGIPVFMSVALATTCNIKHITLNVMLGLSFGLLASFVYLNEGSFCVPMTAPLFLVAGLVISASFVKLRQSNYTQYVYFLPVLFLILLSVEGLNKQTSFNRVQSASAFKDVALSGDQIQHALAQNKTFSNLPTLLRYGFPQPQIMSNQGNNIGDIRRVYFAGGEGAPGTAEFKVSQRSTNSIEYTLIKDTSHIGHWLNWKTSTVSWFEIKPGINRVTWSIEYERKLDPAWYFAPMQDYAVELSAKALINNMVL